MTKKGFPRPLGLAFDGSPVIGMVSGFTTLQGRSRRLLLD